MMMDDDRPQVEKIPIDPDDDAPVEPGSKGDDDDKMEEGDCPRDDSPIDPDPVVPEAAAGGVKADTPKRPVLFSSEDFKIELNGLPKFFGLHEAKKLLVMKMGLKVHKFKPVGNIVSPKYMFINFTNEEDRCKAVDLLNGYVYKGSTLRAFNAKRAKDPYQKQNEMANARGSTATVKSARDQVLEAVCPLAATTPNYEDQLRQKQAWAQEIGDELKAKVMKQLPLLQSKVWEGNQCLADVQEILPSPLVNGYRNKCEFSVGRHPETGEIVVGFRAGSYKQGNISVVEVDHVPNVSEPMKRAVLMFQDFVRKSKYGAYEDTTHGGYWKQLTLRSDRSGGQLMAWVIMHPQGMTEEDKDDIRKGLKSHFGFEAGSGRGSTSSGGGVTSLYVQFFGGMKKGMVAAPIECLSGGTGGTLPGQAGDGRLVAEGGPSSGHIVETLMGGRLSFKISPTSFFQVNVEAAEKLYQICGDLLTSEAAAGKAAVDEAAVDEADGEAAASPKVGGTPPVVLLDVCCGTGTIGLCLANRCQRVVGVDIVKEAIRDAKQNAADNGVSNVEFHAGAAESILPDILGRLSGTGDEGGTVVAIVDPPRSGLHLKAVQALRAAKYIDTLIYVSCDPKAAMNNFVTLARPPSNSLSGDPFVPRKIFPLDMFPHTKHMELVILFKRLPLLKPLLSRKRFR